MEWIIFISWLMLWITIGIGLGIYSVNDDQLINSPELRQYLSQSGITWKWGECVVILNK
jgi:hypothetical protein